MLHRHCRPLKVSAAGVLAAERSGDSLPMTGSVGGDCNGWLSRVLLAEAMRGCHRDGTWCPHDSSGTATPGPLTGSLFQCSLGLMAGSFSTTSWVADQYGSRL